MNQVSQLSEPGEPRVQVYRGSQPRKISQVNGPNQNNKLSKLDKSVNYPSEPGEPIASQELCEPSEPAK